MADQVAIDSVKVLLPDDPATYGLTDAILGAQLDATTQIKTVLFSLRAIAAKIASIEDITESGSSRNQRFHDRLMAMITDWQARSDREDVLTDVKAPARIYTAKRPDLVWPKLQ